MRRLLAVALMPVSEFDRLRCGSLRYRRHPWTSFQDIGRPAFAVRWTRSLCDCCLLPSRGAQDRNQAMRLNHACIVRQCWVVQKHPIR